ncbi:MAG TPA: HPr family phosphocarrier protein [Vicinamibacterales bacterium]|nr:HPr family phosphocarrier protein [Vicinamibacterales bacterium]
MECTITITNSLGLHARAAAKFVHTAGRFISRIRVSKGGREMDGKSIMGLLLLAASQGSSITISTAGPDEAAAMDALCDLVRRGFDEASIDPAHGAAFGPGKDTPWS